jgi:hypothetical protein
MINQLHGHNHSDRVTKLARKFDAVPVSCVRIARLVTASLGVVTIQVILQLATRTDLEARHADGFPFVATGTAS